MNKTRRRYLSIEMPDEGATVDFLGDHPLTVRLTLTDGELHVYVVSATQDAPILLDEVVTVSEADDEEED